MKTSRRNLFVRLAAACAALPFAVFGRKSQASAWPLPPSTGTFSGNHGTSVCTYGYTDASGNQDSSEARTVITRGDTEYRYDELGRLVQTTTWCR